MKNDKDLNCVRGRYTKTKAGNFTRQNRPSAILASALVWSVLRKPWAGDQMKREAKRTRLCLYLWIANEEETFRKQYDLEKGWQILHRGTSWKTHARFPCSVYWLSLKWGCFDNDALILFETNMTTFKDFSNLRTISTTSKLKKMKKENLFEWWLLPQ